MAFHSFQMLANEKIDLFKIILSLGRWQSLLFFYFYFIIFLPTLGLWKSSGFKTQFSKGFAVITNPAEDDHWRKWFLSHFLVSFTRRFLEIKRDMYRQARWGVRGQRLNLLSSLGRTFHTIASVVETWKERAFWSTLVASVVIRDCTYS